MTSVSLAACGLASEPSSKEAIIRFEIAASADAPPIPELRLPPLPSSRRNRRCIKFGVPFCKCCDPDDLEAFSAGPEKRPRFQLQTLPDSHAQTAITIVGPVPGERFDNDTRMLDIAPIADTATVVEGTHIDALPDRAAPVAGETLTRVAWLPFAPLAYPEDTPQAGSSQTCSVITGVPPALCDTAYHERLKLGSGPFVDTHCHLEEVLQVLRRYCAAPSLGKEVRHLTSAEAKNWRILGWITEAAPEEAMSDDPRYQFWMGPASPFNNVWDLSWSELSEAQQEAAGTLGWSERLWERSFWPLPKGRTWAELNPDMRRNLELLGELESSWNQYSAGTSEDAAYTSGQSIYVDTNEQRDWNWLDEGEKAAALALGLPDKVWNLIEMVDVTATIDLLFGPSFEACVTQGCDVTSLEFAQRLVVEHPKVYASLGCHPKNAASYDDAFESRVLNAIKTCGKKIVAWGEFGLDYSHQLLGRQMSNRKQQREVFAKQLKRAVEHQLPMVIHSRAADRDTLWMLRKFVPREWKIHVHSWRGGVSFMEALLREWPNSFVGFSGLVTLDEGEEHLVTHCPLHRILIETDAPYLPCRGAYFSHPGQVPVIAKKIAEIKGLTAIEVCAITRENARAMYGI